MWTAANLSASLGLPALPNGTRLPLWVHGRHLSFSDAAVRVWAQDRRPQRQPWTTECGAVQVGPRLCRTHLGTWGQWHNEDIRK